MNSHLLSVTRDIGWFARIAIAIASHAAAQQKSPEIRRTLAEKQIAFDRGWGRGPLQAEAPTTQTFKPEELEQVVPIALYPDALVAQVLMASTYPVEVVSAARWVKSNKA